MFFRVEEVADGAGFEGEDGDEVGEVELEGRFEEYLRIGLILHEFEEVTHGFAGAQRLEEEEFPEIDVLQIDVVEHPLTHFVLTNLLAVDFLVLLAH